MEKLYVFSTKSSFSMKNMDVSCIKVVDQQTKGFFFRKRHRTSGKGHDFSFISHLDAKTVCHSMLLETLLANSLSSENRLQPRFIRWRKVRSHEEKVKKYEEKESVGISQKEKTRFRMFCPPHPKEKGDQNDWMGFARWVKACVRMERSKELSCSLEEAKIQETSLLHKDGQNPKRTKGTRRTCLFRFKKEKEGNQKEDLFLCGSTR
jgi:hypothetical protein